MDQKGLWSPRHAVWCVAGSTAKDSVRSLSSNMDHGQGLLVFNAFAEEWWHNCSTQSTEDDPVSRERNFQPDGHQTIQMG